MSWSRVTCHSSRWWVWACSCSLTRQEAIDAGARKAGSMFYGAGTYGFYGYVFADLGKEYEFVVRWVTSS